MVIDTRDLWWWVPARPRTVCITCGEKVPVGARVAYLPKGMACMCTICVDGSGIEVHESKRWRAREGRRRQRRRQGDRREGTRPAPSPRPGLRAGQPHPHWPEWIWDGEWFVRRED